MKKLSFLFILASLLVVSCSKDDDTKAPANNNQTNTSGNLLGVWNATSIYYTGSNTSTVGDQEFKITFIGECYNYDFTVTFNENPNTVISDGSYDVKLKTKINDGPETVQDYKGQSFTIGQEWSRNGDKITFKNNGQEDEMTIKTLTANKLVLEGAASQPNPSGTGTIGVDMKMTFER